MSTTVTSRFSTSTRLLLEGDAQTTGELYLALEGDADTSSDPTSPDGLTVENTAATTTITDRIP